MAPRSREMKPPRKKPPPPRASRRLRGSELQDVTKVSAPETRVPYLPPEILSLVAEYLEKRDCKTLRFVSQQWYAMATPFVFNRVYVSAREKDLAVFRNITRNPKLRKSIKEMIYDVSTFQRLSNESYFKRLCIELIVYSHRRKDCPHFTRSRHLKQLAAALDHGMSGSRLYPRFCRYALVREGYLEWQELAMHDDDRHAKWKFFQDLCLGLSVLTNLQTVIMDHNVWEVARRDKWILIDQNRPHYTSGPARVGSPLSRIWSVCRPSPQSPAGPDDLSSTYDLNVIVRALSQTERKLKRFSLSFLLAHGLSPRVFSVHDVGNCFAQKMSSSLWRL